MAVRRPAQAQDVQRRFDTGIVLIVEHRQGPGEKLIERATAIRRQWIDYWMITTGGSGTMTGRATLID